MSAEALPARAVVRRHMESDLREEEEMKRAAATAAATSLVALLPPITMDGLARCTICESMYDATSEASSACYYHPGMFSGIGGSPRSGRIQWTKAGVWSCCNATEEFSRGCRRAACHTPCQITAAAMRRTLNIRGTNAKPLPAKALKLKLPQPTADTSFARLRAEQDGNESGLRRASGPNAVSGAASPKYGPYTVGVGDSLASIALRHGMDRHALQRLNGLLSTQLYPGQILQVANPTSQEKTPEEQLEEDRRRVMRYAKCDRYEAAYYLDQAAGDVHRACALRAADEAWEEAATAEAANERAGKLALASAMSLRIDISRATVNRALASAAR